MDKEKAVMVIFITGKSGAGKTTLAYQLALENNAIVLDGDEFRQIFPIGFSDSDREIHIMRMARVAGLIEKQGLDVIIAAIIPKRIWRDQARTFCKDSKLIYLTGGTLWDGTEYEEPNKEELR